MLPVNRAPAASPAISHTGFAACGKIPALSCSPIHSTSNRNSAAGSRTWRSPTGCGLPRQSRPASYRSARPGNSIALMPQAIGSLLPCHNGTQASAATNSRKIDVSTKPVAAAAPIAAGVVLRQGGAMRTGSVLTKSVFIGDAEGDDVTREALIRHVRVQRDVLIIER